MWLSTSCRYVYNTKAKISLRMTYIFGWPKEIPLKNKTKKNRNPQHSWNRGITYIQNTKLVFFNLLVSCFCLKKKKIIWQDFKHPTRYPMRKSTSAGVRVYNTTRTIGTWKLSECSSNVHRFNLSSRQDPRSMISRLNPWEAILAITHAWLGCSQAQ